MANISVTKTIYTVTFAGEEFSGTATLSGSKTGVEAIAVPATNLTNGDTVTVTVTPTESGNTVNKKASINFNYTVTGLIVTPNVEVGDETPAETPTEAVETPTEAVETPTEAEAEITEVDVPLVAAQFDEGSLDPYEVANAQ